MPDNNESWSIHPKRFQILSLSGGGYRGVYSAAVLETLEEKAGKPLGRCFDLIAGTSIGGIIGLGLALEKPMPQIIHAFKKHGTRIFSDRPAAKGRVCKLIDLCRSAFSPKYGDAGLREAITEIVGSETRLDDALHPIIVPTVNVTTGAPQFFKTPHHQNFQRDWKEKVVDIALATSAAPTFFPLAKIDNSHFADGGLYANAPDIHALHEAIHFFSSPEVHIHVLSVGTTTASFSFSHRIGRDLGGIKWMMGSRLISTIYSAQQQCEASMMKHRLGDRYIRIDGIQSKEQQDDLALDVATKDVQEMLMGLGKESAKRALGEPYMAAFLAHEAPSPHFYYGKNARKQGEF